MEMKISISSWSLHETLPDYSEDGKPYRFFVGRTSIAPPNPDSLLDFPRLCSEEFNVRAVELCQRHFLSWEWDYVDKVKESLKSSGVKVTNIPVDFWLVAEEDAERRRIGFDMIRRWFEIAKYLGSPMIRVNAVAYDSSDLREEVLLRAIDGYKKLVETAKETCVKLAIENHGGITNNPDNIIRIIETIGSEYLVACPDFQGGQMTYEGLKKLAKYAAIVHVKTLAFNEQGEEINVDIEKYIDIFKRRSFQGYYTIEYGGKGDGREGIRKSLALIRRSLS